MTPQDKYHKNVMNKIIKLSFSGSCRNKNISIDELNMIVDMFHKDTISNHDEKQENYIDNPDNTNYLICDRFATGGYGSVYIIQSQNTDKQFVAKVFHDPTSSINLNELYINAKMPSPYMAKFLTVGIHKEKIYTVMRNHGKKINFLVKKQYFDEENIKIFIKNLFHALFSIHSQGLVHRDLSPDNVLFNRRSRKVKLIDFGFAHCEKFHEKNINFKVCKINFRPPEVNSLSTNLHNYSDKIDIWSAGRILQEVISCTNLKNCSFVNEVFKLTTLMLSENPEHRPNSAQLVQIISMRSFD
jgi:serine/threonine protein kinase